MGQVPALLAVRKSRPSKLAVLGRQGHKVGLAETDHFLRVRCLDVPARARYTVPLIFWGWVQTGGGDGRGGGWGGAALRQGARRRGGGAGGRPIALRLRGQSRGPV